MIGKHIQNYEIRSHLGEGGMGTVFRAADSVLGREVALKMLHTPLMQQPLFLERFKKEARVLAQLLHPNIAVIYNMIEQENTHFMVMEYIEGKNLDALLREHKTLSHKIVIPIFIQALEGLRHAHKKGIYHRDIKPSNLILTPDGTVKLMDFGIAMVKGEQRLTQANRVVGTVEYLAPEIIQGKEPSTSTDLYAMGVTMYELLTGKLPFEGNTDYNLMQDIMKKKPLSVDKLNGDVPKALSNIVMKILEKKPEHRYADAKEFQMALLNAFPDMKYAELNESYLSINQKVQVRNAAPATVVSKKRSTPKPTSVQSTRTDGEIVPVQFLSGLKEKLFARENRVLILCLFAVVVAAVVALMYSGSSSEQKVASVQDSTRKEGPGIDNSEVKKDLSQSGGGGIIQPERKNDDVIIPPANEIKEPEKKEPEKKETENKETEKKETDKKELDKKKLEDKKLEDKKKEDEKKKKEQDKKNEELKKEEEKKVIVTPVEEKKEVKPDDNKRESKTIRLATAPDINLYLRDAINPETVKEDQKLYFTVTSPVRYGGETIVERGATAFGKVKFVGKKKISIIITSVTAVNGQSLKIYEVELSGRIEDMVNARNYSAKLWKGAVLNL